MNTIGDGLRAIGKSIQDLRDMIDDPNTQKQTIDTINSVAVYSEQINKQIIKCTKECKTITEFNKCMGEFKSDPE